jgi:hypothetical protein
VAFKAGQSGNPDGRPKGATNKVTQELKEMIREALEGAGGVDYLIDKAESHPAAFLALVGRILPLQVNADVKHEHTGELSQQSAELLEQLRASRRYQGVQESLPH